MERGIVIDNFTLIPNRLFLRVNGKESLFDKCKDHKLLSVMSYLYINTNRIGETIFTLKDLIIKSKVKPSANEGKSNDQFRDLLLLLQNEGILSCDFDVKAIKLGELIRCRYNSLEKDEHGNNIKFTMIDCEVIEKIMSYDKQKIDNNRLLYFYGYLASRMYKRSSKDGNIEKIGGRAEVCFPSYKTITDETGISEASIKGYTDILCDMDLLRVANAGIYEVGYKNKIRESPNIYTFINKEDIGIEKAKTKWHKNLIEGIKLCKKNIMERYPNAKFIDIKDESKIKLVRGNVNIGEYEKDIA